MMLMHIVLQNINYLEILVYKSVDMGNKLLIKIIEGVQRREMSLYSQTI